MAAQSLCTVHETVVFTCPAKHSTVSVCASRHIGPRSGYLQFHIGNSARNISYPAGHTPQTNIVTFGYAYVGQGPPGHHILLKDGHEVYGIITTDGRGPQYGDEETAFVRQHDGKSVGALICDHLTSLDAAENILGKAGFQNTDSDTLHLP